MFLLIKNKNKMLLGSNIINKRQMSQIYKLNVNVMLRIISKVLGILVLINPNFLLIVIIIHLIICSLEKDINMKILSFIEFLFEIYIHFLKPLFKFSVLYIK